MRPRKILLAKKQGATVIQASVFKHLQLFRL